MSDMLIRVNELGAFVKHNLEIRHWKLIDSNIYESDKDFHVYLTQKYDIAGIKIEIDYDISKSGNTVVKGFYYDELHEYKHHRLAVGDIVLDEDIPHLIVNNMTRLTLGDLTKMEE